MNGEGHTHVQMDVGILHRMKLEPSDYRQAEELSCHSFERQITENTFVQNYAEHITEDEYGSKGAANPNHDPHADVLANDEYRDNEKEGMVDQVVVTQKNPYRRIVPGHEEAESDNHRHRRRTPYMRNSPRWTYNGIRSILHRTLPSVSFLPDSPIVTRTSLLINNSSDIFTQRLRKILKVLIAKRTFSLQQKIMNLEQRNAILEDTARNLKTTLTHLVSEKENKKTKTVSRGTQVSLGMIISRTKSHCVEEPESLPVNERTPYHNFSDGPVIVNVFGNLHVPFSGALPQVPAVVESSNAPSKLVESPVLRLPHANVLYPKVQHVYSLNTSTPGSLNQELLSPGCETYVLPEHRLLGMPRTKATHESMTRSLQRTNEQKARQETCNLLRNVSQLTANQQGLPSGKPSHLLHNEVETTYTIASVHPQHIVSSQDITSSIPVQPETQVTHYPSEEGATPDFRPFLPRPTQSLASRQRSSEKPPLQSQYPVYIPQQDKNLSSVSISSSYCLKKILQDSWKEIFSRSGTVSVQPFNQPIRQDAHASAASDRIASGTNPDSNQCIRNEGDFVPLVGQEQTTVNNTPVPVPDTGIRLPSSASLYSLSQHQGFPVTRLPRVCRPFEVSDKGIVAMNPNTQSDLNDFSTHVNSSNSFTHSRSSITVPTQEAETEHIDTSVLKLNHAVTLTSSKQGKTLTSRQDSEREHEKRWVIDKNTAFSADEGQQTRAREQHLYVSGNEQMPFHASDDGLNSDCCQNDNRHQQANLLVQQQQRPCEEGQQQPLLQQNQERRFSLQQLKQRQWQQRLKQLRQKWQLQQRQHQQPQQESEQWHQQQQQQQNQQALSLQQLKQRQWQQCLKQRRNQQQYLQQRQHQQPQLHSEQWPQQYEKQHVLSLQQLEQQQWQQRLKQRRQQQKHLQQRQHQQPQLQGEQRHHQQQQQEKQHVFSLQQLEQQQWQQHLKQRRQQQQHLQQRQHQQPQQQRQQLHVLLHQRQQQEKQQLQQHHLLFQHQPFNQQPQPQNRIEQEQSQQDQEQQLQKQDEGQQLEKQLYQRPHQQQQQQYHELQIQELPKQRQLSSLIHHQHQANWLQSPTEMNQVVPERMQNSCVSTPLSSAQCAAAIREQSHNSQNVSSPNASSIENTSSASIQSNSITVSISNGVLRRSSRDDLAPMPAGNDCTLSGSNTASPIQPGSNDNHSMEAFESEVPVLYEKKKDRRSSFSQAKYPPTASQFKMDNKPSDSGSTANNATTNSAMEVEDEDVGTSSSALPCDTSPNSSPAKVLQAESGERADQEHKYSIDEMIKKSLLLKPVLSIEQNNTDIVLTWDLQKRDHESSIIKYELFVMAASNQTEPGDLSSWGLLGEVGALALPMACTMNQFLPGASYYFKARAITEKYERGIFSDPCFVTIKGKG